METVKSYYMDHHDVSTKLILANPYQIVFMAALPINQLLRTPYKTVEKRTGVKSQEPDIHGNIKLFP